MVSSWWVLFNKIRVNCNNRKLFSKCDDIFVPVETGKTSIQLECVCSLTYVGFVFFFFDCLSIHHMILAIGNWNKGSGAVPRERLTNGRYQLRLMSCKSGISSVCVCASVCQPHICNVHIHLCRSASTLSCGARWTTNSLDDANFGFYIRANKTGHYWHRINDFISTE